MVFISQICATCIFESCNSWCQGNNYQYGRCYPITVPVAEQQCQCIGAKAPNWPRDYIESNLIKIEKSLLLSIF